MRHETQKSLRENFVKKERLSKIYRKRATIVPAQEKAIEILESKGIHCVREKRILTEKSFFLVDIYIPEYRMCIEIDGKSHESNEQKEKDKIRDDWMIRNGYWVVRVKDTGVYKGFFQKINSSIKFRNHVLKKYNSTDFS